MSEPKYPCRDAIREANDLYLDTMRPYIVHNLKQVKGEQVEDLIEEALKDNQIDNFHDGLEDHDDVGSAIDINHIPQIIKKHWSNVFGQKFDWKLVVQSVFWLIRDGRNICEHRGSKDLDFEFTRTYLYLISCILRVIKRSEKISEVDKIRDQFLSENSAKQISDITELLEIETTKKKEYKRKFEKSEEQLEEVRDRHNTDKVELKNVKNQLEEALFHKEKIDEDLINIKDDLRTAEDNLKAAEEAWLETDKNLKNKMTELQEVENEKNSIEEQYETLKKKYEKTEIENKEYTDNLTSIENQLLEVKIEKSNVEQRFKTLVNPIFPPLNNASDVRIIDRRDTDRKKYLIDLLETKRTSVIYVHDSEKIKQFMTFMGHEKEDIIGVHNKHITADEEKELLTRLENRELYAIVSDAIISSLPEQHSVDHFIICHPVLCLDEFSRRCQPAFTSKDTYIHLIYDSSQDFQNIIERLNQKYWKKMY